MDDSAVFEPCFRLFAFQALFVLHFCSFVGLNQLCVYLQPATSDVI